jgi:hypothetical protein
MAKNNFATCKVNAYKTESNFEKGTYIESAWREVVREERTEVAEQLLRQANWLDIRSTKEFASR